MNNLEIFLCIIFNSLWIIPFILEIIIYPFIENLKRKNIVNRLNKEYSKTHGYKLKLLCTDCKHCIWRYHHPFSKYGNNYWLAVSKIPYYCKKFNKHLKHDGQLRCIAKLSKDAMYEE